MPFGCFLEKWKILAIIYPLRASYRSYLFANAEYSYAMQERVLNVVAFCITNT